MDDGRRAIALAHWNEVKIDEYCRGLGDVSQCSILFGKCVCHMQNVYRLYLFSAAHDPTGFCPWKTMGDFYPQTPCAQSHPTSKPWLRH